MVAHALLLLSLLSAPTSTTPGRPPIRLAVELHGALLNSGDGVPNLGLAFGGALRGGVEFGRWGVFLHLENDAWGGTNYGAKVVAGVLNYGIGADYRYAGGFVRSALTFGASTLLFNTPIDRAGSTGIFLYAVPVGLRWELSKLLTLGLDPIGFIMEIPSLTRIPLAHLQYRFGLSLEFGL